MSRDGSTTFVWGDGEHQFKLAIGQLRELQENVDAGPAFILERLQTGRWMVDDIREPIRLGLIGGGMKPADAHKLVVRYVDERPLLENLPAARAILLVALVGAGDEEPGKTEAPETGEQSPLSEESSASAPEESTAPEPQ